MLPPKSPFAFLSGLLLVLAVSAAYLYAFPQANLFYAGIVLLHALVGVIATIVLLIFLVRVVRQGNVLSTVGWLLILIGGIAGMVLIKTGAIRSEWNLLYAHMLVSIAGLAILMANRIAPVRAAGIVVLLVAVAAGAHYLRVSRWRNQARIENPAMPPGSMDQEGDGSQGPFFPSSAQIYGGQTIPSNYFMESDSCERCHADIYKQWFGSVHHFSSFNNQWYRKSIEYMQDTVGTQPSKWCGGCHDPAVLYSGMMDTPIKQIVHRPEAQAGLGCMMCHSIAHVKSTMGQADFYLEYPKLHEMAATKNPAVRFLHDFLVQLNPEPHRRVFLKPFMRDQTAEFCSSCHKVHLDVPVNHYRWIRGFNEYDNWQASGVSGEGARSFYYPEKPAQCADCHMPLTQSNDAGNLGGFVHSHRFPGANTAVPSANEDTDQLNMTEQFLKSGALSVDIFGMSPEGELPKPAAVAQPELSTTFAVGEESERNVVPQAESDLSPLVAPLHEVNPVVRPGDTVRLDVVVRTKKVGHFFPGGTVDAYDTWLELKVDDDEHRTVFWSGRVEGGGKGPVEKGAHFYRSLQVDAHGNRINKRNAWATRSVVYVHLIPPGAADTVHYRLRVPENAGKGLTLEARLCYRKFSWWNTQFSFAGEPDETKPGTVTPDFDDRNFVFTKSLQGVSAKEEKIPDVPIVVLAEDSLRINVVPRGTNIAWDEVKLSANSWQRWNDYGIGLLLQGDLKGAQRAFEQVTKIDPNNPDGWVNIGRVAVQEGDMDLARKVLEKALVANPNLARANFFYAKVLRNDGNYDGAAQRLRDVLAQYPRDRVVLNELGRILFLQRRYQEAVGVLQQTLAVDPEDLQAHYNLMLCYNGIGDEKLAREHQERYLRFKADEASQAITGPYRLLNPEDNNERQPIHEHVSAPLQDPPRVAVREVTTTARSGQ